MFIDTYTHTTGLKSRSISSHTRKCGVGKSEGDEGTRIENGWKAYKTSVQNLGTSKPHLFIQNSSFTCYENKNIGNSRPRDYFSQKCHFNF